MKQIKRNTLRLSCIWLELCLMIDICEFHILQGVTGCGAERMGWYGSVIGTNSFNVLKHRNVLETWVH